MTRFRDRIIQAAKLNAGVYEEVEADKSALTQAMAVVILASIATGIGGTGKVGVAGIFSGILVSLTAWFLWAFLTYIIGAKLFPENRTRSSIGELLRTIGFACSPGMVRVLGVIPQITDFIFFITTAWIFAAMVIGVKQALDYQSSLRAIGVCVTGWLSHSLILAALFVVTRGPS